MKTNCDIEISFHVPRWAKVVRGGGEDGDELYWEIITWSRCNWRNLLSSLSPTEQQTSLPRRELKICCHNSRHLLQAYLDFGAAAHTRDGRMRCPGKDNIKFYAVWRYLQHGVSREIFERFFITFYGHFSEIKFPAPGGVGQFVTRACGSWEVVGRNFNFESMKIMRSDVGVECARLQNKTLHALTFNLMHDFWWV